MTVLTFLSQPKEMKTRRIVREAMTTAVNPTEVLGRAKQPAMHLTCQAAAGMHLRMAAGENCEPTRHSWRRPSAALARRVPNFSWTHRSMT